jgi:hypothetical protein|tara:strand:- start:45524 stop:45781 length:258 start_codon:yes stop_codon:yes gene_type:complete
MDYNFLAKKAIEKLFEDTDLSVGEIIRELTKEKFTGLKAENRGVLTSISDKQWYGIIEKIAAEELEGDPVCNDLDWEKFVSKTNL